MMISVADLKSESGLMKKNNDRAAAGYESIRQFFSKRINIINKAKKSKEAYKEAYDTINKKNGL